ncbi:hypothetical protein GFS60_06730 (plasmid) [Rhodococcus sp. WAY2]|nr:hypothetical protein GFS60_06730 [Rhodococcus sp. WAY2]
MDFFKRLTKILFQIDDVWRQLGKGSELYRGRMFELEQDVSKLSGCRKSNEPRRHLNVLWRRLL